MSIDLLQTELFLIDLRWFRETLDEDWESELLLFLVVILFYNTFELRLVLLYYNV